MANRSTRLYKTVLFKEAKLAPVSEKMIDELVDEISIFGIASRSIPAFKNDERDYSEILFLFCRLKAWKSGIEEVLLSAFEKPAILICTTDPTEFTISASRKRFSLNESGRQISEAFSCTHKMRVASAIDTAYLRTLAIPNMPVSNLFAMHEAFMRSLVEIDDGLRENIDGWIEKKQIKNPEKFRELARKYHEITVAVHGLEAEHDQYRRDGEFGDGLNAHTQIIEKQREMKGLILAIRKTIA